MKVAFMHFWTLQMRRGVETMVLSLANELAEQGIDVSLLTARQTQEPLVRPSGNVRLKQFPSTRYYAATAIVPFYFADLVRNKYDVAVVFFADFGEGLALRLAAPFMKSRLCLYLTFPYMSAPHRYKSYKRWGWGRKADLILADAEYTAQDGREFFGRSVELLPSGTDPKRFEPDPAKREAMRRQFGFEPEDIVLLSVAALEERKGAHRVIEAMPGVLARDPRVRYLVLGEGPQKARLEGRVRELGIEQSVVFAGTTTNLPACYNAADVFVLLSDMEAGSIACLEAMSSGLPVIVSGTGGFREVVNSDTGRIVDPDDKAAIAASVLEIAGDCDLRKRLGEAGREVILQSYSWTRIAEQMRLLFRQAGL